MHVSAGWQFDLEVHPPDWRFPADPSWLAGWIRPEGNLPITDIRARLHHRVILGFFGLPHPAFTEKLPGLNEAPRPGFSFLLTPHPGATLLRLEVRDQSGQWQEFFRTEITASPDAAIPPPAPDFTGSFSRLVTKLLRHRMYSPGRGWDELADDLVTSFVAEPVNAHPNPPFIGAMEEPREIGRLRYGRIPVTGWLAHAGAAIVRLSAVIDPLPAAALPRSATREDIVKAFPAARDHGQAGFAGDLAFPPGLAAPALLKLIAELDNGERHLVFAQRFTPLFHDDPGVIPPLVPGRTFVRAMWSLFRSSGRHAIPRRHWLHAARAVWACYRAMPVYRSGNFPPLPPLPPTRQQPTRANARASHVASPVGNGLPAVTLISPDDDMSVPDATHYFQVGREALLLIQEANALAGNHRIDSILDLPCGFGRVGRWLRTAYPAAQLAASDTQRPGVDFCVGHLGATGVHAHVDGRHWAELTGPYDVIWCGSLLTHFGWAQWVEHLRRFAERLSPTGVLVFTSHGMLALERLQSGEKDYGLTPDGVRRLCTAAVADGFGYVDYADTPGYGISVAQPGWIREVVARETDLHVLEIRASAWGQHQDVVVCTRRAAGK